MKSISLSLILLVLLVNLQKINLYAQSSCNLSNATLYANSIDNVFGVAANITWTNPSLADTGNGSTRFSYQRVAMQQDYPNTYGYTFIEIGWMKKNTFATENNFKVVIAYLIEYPAGSGIFAPVNPAFDLTYLGFPAGSYNYMINRERNSQDQVIHVFYINGNYIAEIRPRETEVRIADRVIAGGETCLGSEQMNYTYYQNLVYRRQIIPGQSATAWYTWPTLPFYQMLYSADYPYSPVIVPGPTNLLTFYVYP